MLTATQYDLFGELEAVEARRAAARAWDTTPQTCRQCGHEEPTGVALERNHGSGYHAGRDECMAMYLSRNHVVIDSRNPDLSHLEHSLAKAREVWRNRLDDLAASLAENGLDPDGRTAA